MALHMNTFPECTTQCGRNAEFKTMGILFTSTERESSFVQMNQQHHSNKWLGIKKVLRNHISRLLQGREMVLLQDSSKTQQVLWCVPTFHPSDAAVL